jgi:hypothetical protein
MGGKNYNPEKRRAPMGWRGRSYKKGGEPVVDLKAARQLDLVDKKLLLLTGSIDETDYEALILAEQDERFGE